MQAKLKVFLSSAQFQDEFQAERASLAVAFKKLPLTAGFVLWRIEDTASPEPVARHYRAQVIDSDLLIILLGKSYREAVAEEYKTAAKNNIPVFAFIRQRETRDRKLLGLLKEVQRHATYASYSSPVELADLVEDSLYQHFLRGSQQPAVTEWRQQRQERAIGGLIDEEERALRLLTSLVATPAARSGKSALTDALVLGVCTSSQEPQAQDAIVRHCCKVVRSESQALKQTVSSRIEALLAEGRLLQDSHCGISPSTDSVSRLALEEAKQREADELLFDRLYKLHLLQLQQHDISRAAYRYTVTHAITQVLYDTAIEMAEEEFGKEASPFPYDSDQLSRLASNALLSVFESSGADTWSGPSVSYWHPFVLDVLRSEDVQVASWLQRLRKAYWGLAALGLDPAAADYATRHLGRYCVYLDSHIVIRALVGSGGDSELCSTIVKLAAECEVDMRLSEPIFDEVLHVLAAANQAVLAADMDILRAMRVSETVRRRNDVLSGFLVARELKPSLSWDVFIGRFYSAADQSRLARYLANELSISVDPPREFSQEELGQVEDITQRLLERRARVSSRQSPGRRPTPSRAADKRYDLRNNEARQMAIIYLLRSQAPAEIRYWFITFDEFVYDVSAALSRGGEPLFEFPCYMKPATWLNILVDASPRPLEINSFREVLTSPEVQRAADQLESEVIAHMLRSRIDEEISSVETLRDLFSDMVCRPAVNDAYQHMVQARGARQIAEAGRIRDVMLGEMENVVTRLQRDLDSEKKRAAKAEGKTRHLKKQLGRERLNRNRGRRKRR